jgi:hypothetical protein
VPICYFIVVLLLLRHNGLFYYSVALEDISPPYTVHRISRQILPAPTDGAVAQGAARAIDRGRDYAKMKVWKLEALKFVCNRARASTRVGEDWSFLDHGGVGVWLGMDVT